MWVSPPARGLEQEPDRIELAGAMNETVSLRFAAQSDEQPIANPDLRVSSFVSADGSTAPVAVRIYRMHPVPVDDWPGWHIRSRAPAQRDSAPLDALVPLRAPRGGLPSNWPAFETIHFWADVDIPKGTSEGTYTASIALLAGKKVIGRIELVLTVWPFVLPDESAVPMIMDIDHTKLFAHHVRRKGRPYRMTVDDWRRDAAQSELDAVLGYTLRLLQRHRVTPVLHRLRPIVKVTADEEVTVDWGQYDSVVAPCMSGLAFFNRVPSPVWPFPWMKRRAETASADLPVSPAQQKIRRAYVRECAAHFHEKGWLDRSYAIAPDATEPCERAFRAVRETARLARSADSHIPVLARLFPQDMAPYGWPAFPYTDLTDSVDIWLPRAQFYDPAVMAAERKAGRRTWVAVDRPPFSGSVAIHAGEADARVLAWQAAAIGAQAVYVGCCNNWPNADSAPLPEDCVRNDANVLIYPGAAFGLNEPVTSVRLKYLRRSEQDAAYMRLLDEHGLDHVTTAMRNALAPRAAAETYHAHFADGRPLDTPFPLRRFEAARHIMADEIVRASYPERGTTRSANVARVLNWRRFMLSSEDLAVQVDGTRLRVAGSREEPALYAETTLTVSNSTRLPATGEVHLGPLPPAWTADRARYAFATIEPGDSVRSRLTARTVPSVGSVGGSTWLPVELESANGRRHHALARIALVTALPIASAIEIDGDLSDWPVGTYNTASGFALIHGHRTDSGAWQSSDTPTSPSELEISEIVPYKDVRPRRDTIAFVLHDADHLYIAVNCEAYPAPPLPTSTRKRVTYDDMIPVGEALIEILLDPLNGGTRSPADLFHIVVKKTGTDLTEQGISFDPPCGTSRPWPVQIDVATQTAGARWTVEMKIPLAAFGPVSTSHTVWGLNVTRFDAVNQEFSTWSGATHNAYDPLSLGNMYWP